MLARRELEALAQLAQSPLDDREVQVALVLEVDVDEGAAQPRPARDFIDRGGFPADLRVQGHRRINDLASPPLLLLLAPFGDVRHEWTIHPC